MHFFILLALAHGPGALPGAVCGVPGAACHVAQTALQPVPSTRQVEESVQSAALGRAMKYRVLLPEGYATSERRYPVLYLLHGLGGDYTDWTSRTNLAEYSRALPLIIVMPDGENSWYTNAAHAPQGRFEDYILTDLQADVVAKYRTVNSRHGRAIAGLSMGGYGALKLALRRPGAFAVAASFSGAFSATRPELLKMIPSQEEPLRRIYGDDDSAVRRQNDLYLLAAAAKPASTPYVYIDCGIRDGLVTANREVVAALHRQGVAYEYHEVAGAHTWEYWDQRIRLFLPLLMNRMPN